MDSDQDKKFQFMLKEYEMFYGKFEMHYSAVEKTIFIYFLILGGTLSASSLSIKNWGNFSIFNLNNLQIIFSVFISAIGLITILKIVEHRLLIIKYVKGLNLNRKWFFDNCGKNDLEAYSIFEASEKSPKYYKPFRHFFWEVLGMTAINSSFLSIATINLGRKLLNLKSKDYRIYNWGWFFILFITMTILVIKYYKWRGQKEENELKNKSYGNPKEFFS